MSNSDSDKIRFVLKGVRTHEGSIELGAIAGYTTHLDRALRAVVQHRRGLPASKPGPPDRETRIEAGLRLVGIEKGSAVLVFESEEPRLFEGGDEAVRDLLAWLDGDRPVNRVIVDAMEDARRALGEGGAIEVRTPWRDSFVFDEGTAAHLRSGPVEPIPSELLVSGWLHGADIDPDHVVIRDASGIEWTCHYIEEQESELLALIGSIVQARGQGWSKGRRGRIEIESIEGVSSPSPVADLRGTAPSELSARLMREQGVTEAQSLESLRMDLDDEEAEAFFAIIREMN